MLPKKIIEIRVSKALYRSKLPDLDYSLNPYQGCSFGCVYCYAIHFTGIEEAANNWGEVVAVKVNLVEVLRREVMHTTKKGVVGVSTITDPYMPIEARYSLTRRSIELLLAYRFRVSIQTKSPLVLRDLDMLRTHRDKVDVGMTITTMDPSLARVIEPRAPHPLARARALKKISDSLIYTWIFLGPIIPGLNDSEEHIEGVIGAASESNSLVIFDLLNIYDRTWSYMKERLDRDEVTKIYRVVRYGSKGYWSRIKSLVLKLCTKYGVMCIDFHLSDPFETNSWPSIRKAGYIGRGGGSQKRLF
ncbi:radical SAM protein [Desulfurococcaceae archaeon AG1]|nr:radical SAM protein [Desulfurococcaceae archaeon AG1]